LAAARRILHPRTGVPSAAGDSGGGDGSAQRRQAGNTASSFRIPSDGGDGSEQCRPPEETGRQDGRSYRQGMYS
jgi:hypothetical protein